MTRKQLILLLTSPLLIFIGWFIDELLGMLVQQVIFPGYYGAQCPNNLSPCLILPSWFQSLELYTWVPPVLLIEAFFFMFGKKKLGTIQKSSEGRHTFMTRREIYLLVASPLIVFIGWMIDELLLQIIQNTFFPDYGAGCSNIAGRPCYYIPYQLDSFLHSITWVIPVLLVEALFFLFARKR